LTIPITATIEEFGRGAWVADVTMTETPAGSFDLGGEIWNGANVSPPVQDGGRYRARMVGGAGKLTTMLPERNYPFSLTCALIAKDILAECGELPGAITAPKRVAYYERARGTAGQALNELCDAAGVTWWISRGGFVNIAPERPTAGTVNADKCPQLGADTDGSMVLNVEDSTLVQPGMKLSNGTTIRHIRWQFDSKLTADCSITQPLPDRDSSFYLRTYAAKVDKQNSNRTVDVIVDGRFKLSGVRLFAGMPGVKVVVNPGETVCVGFLGGNRSAPYAFGFEQTEESGAQAAGAQR
jgi:hypothetical protein